MAFPNLDYNERHQLLTALFIDGLCNSKVKRHTLASQAATFALAFGTAQNLEASVGATTQDNLVAPAQLPLASAMIPRQNRQHQHHANATVDQHWYQRGIVQGRPQDRHFQIRCHYCGKPGHMQRACL